MAYCTSQDLALLLQPMLKHSADFSDTVFPTKAMVNTYIDWVSAEIDQILSSIGYKIPLVALEGESLSSSLTYLKLVNALGAASLIASKGLRPTPAQFGSSGSDDAYGRSYQDEKNFLLARSAIRADYYPGTSAEFRLEASAGMFIDNPSPEKVGDFYTFTQKTNLLEQQIMDIGKRFAIEGVYAS